MAGAPGSVQPWAKAGLILTAATKPGSRYAAVMLTGAHGVRMQFDYVHDIAGPAASPAAPRWLRLTRSGTTVTTYESADGRDLDDGRIHSGCGLAADRPRRDVRDLTADRADRAGARAGRRWRGHGRKRHVRRAGTSGWMVARGLDAQDFG